MSNLKNQSRTDGDAVFIGWQNSLSGEIFPMFNITAQDHPFNHSTVSEKTLCKLNLRVPQTQSPYPETPKALWDKLGTKLNYPRTAREAITMAALDYTVEKKSLGLKTGLNQDAYAILRTDTGDILGVATDNNEPVQNIDAFTFFDTLVADNDAVYETAGILDNGECAWIMARLHGYINIQGKDIIYKYILLTNNHRTSSPVRMKIIPIRAVCNNTLTAALRGAGDMSIGHTPHIPWDSKQAAKINIMSDYLCEELSIIFNGMAAKKITNGQLREYIQELVPDSIEQHNESKTQKIRASVLQLHDCGLGANLARGTLWGAFNSVAEYTDHLMSDEDPQTRLNSIWFGRGEQLKVKAFDLAQRLMTV
jgi:phage/plasmid-like protein (TIGR03299 family)